MLEKFTKDEIKQIKKELKELGPDSDTKYFKLKNAREALYTLGKYDHKLLRQGSR